MQEPIWFSLPLDFSLLLLLYLYPSLLFAHLCYCGRFEYTRLAAWCALWLLMVCLENFSIWSVCREIKKVENLSIRVLFYWGFVSLLDRHFNSTKRQSRSTSSSVQVQGNKYKEVQVQGNKLSCILNNIIIHTINKITYTDSTIARQLKNWIQMDIKYFIKQFRKKNRFP